MNTPNQTTPAEMGEAIAEFREKAEQVAAAKRSLHGLPILAMESDSQPGRSALWMDNGLAGVGQVAISTGEFPCVQTGAVAALANVAASLDFAAILTALQQYEGDRLITLWQKTNELCLDWDFHISENAHELREILATLGKQGVRQITTYRLGPKVEALAHLSRSIVGEGE